MEGEHIIAGSDDAELVELPVLESGVDSGHNVTIPEDVDEGISFPGRPAECTGLEERDGIVLAGLSGQWCGRSERSGESIRAGG